METSRARWLNLFWLYLKRILIVDAVFIGIGTLWRGAFLFFFGGSQLVASSSSDLLKAFILGARFDSTVLFYVNAIPLLILFILTLLSGFRFIENFVDRCFQNFNKFLTAYFTLMLFIVTFISAVDLGFYSFYQDRINVLIFGFFEDDTTALIKTIWRNYPMVWIFLGLALFVGLLWKGLKINFAKNNEWFPLRAQKASAATLILFSFAVFFINGVGARGSLSLFPLSEIDTGISKNIFINHLCFNGPRAFTRAIELKSQSKSRWDSNLRHFGYSEDGRQAFADFFKIPLEKVPSDPLELMRHRTAKNDWAEKNHPHVLLLVMESLGGFWLQYDKPEFDLMGELKKHFDEDTYTTHFLSSTNATIGSLSCLMAGTSQRPISDFLTESDYLQVPFRSSPAHTFKDAGYKARFIYGGNPGWREINKFALRQGFDTVEGENEIAEHLGGLKERHDWGLYDEDLFNYLYTTLNEAPGPQFILAMTTTNHPPYQLPSSYQSPELKVPGDLQSRLIADPSLAQNRFRTYRYSTSKLAAFLDRVKHSSLRDKLIIAVTGDHTFWIVNFGEDELLQKGSVPFYLYTPKAIQKKLPADTFGSHADILPTLYNLALSDKTYDSLAKDLFAKDPGYAVNASNLIANQQGAVLVAAQAKDDRGLKWQGNFDRLVSTEMTEEQKQLSLKYKSLMGVLDYYFIKEKQNQKGSMSHADSRR